MPGLIDAWLEAADAARRWGDIQPTYWCGYMVGETRRYIYVVPTASRTLYGPEEVRDALHGDLDLRGAINLRVRVLRRHAALRPRVPNEVARLLRDHAVDGLLEAADGRVLAVVRDSTGFSWLPYEWQPCPRRALEAPVWCGPAGGFAAYGPGRRVEYWWITPWGLAATVGVDGEEIAAYVADYYRVPYGIVLAWLSGQDVLDLADLASLGA